MDEEDPAGSVSLETLPAFIGIGSNVGNRRSLCRKAVQAHQRNSAIQITRISSLYETSPIGFLEQRRFYNAVLAIETVLSPQDLLEHCQDIERSLGKRVVVQDGPRSIDLDLLFYADHVSKTAELILPHPELIKRHFVLIPLVEIAPDFIHPISLYTTKKHLEQLGPVSKNAVEQVFNPGWEKG